MHILKTLLAFLAVTVGFVLFVGWLAFWKIPCNIVKEFDDYAV